MKKGLKILSVLVVLTVLLGGIGIAVRANSGEKELVELRTEFGKVFTLPDGTYKYVGYSEPIHYVDVNGKYSEIDNNIETIKELDIETNTTVTTYHNKANSWSVYFTYLLERYSGVSISANGHAINFGVYNPDKKYEASDFITEKAEKAPTVEENTLTYENVYADTDIKYTVLPNTVKEEIIINSENSPLEYVFLIETGFLTPVLENGEIKLLDENGETQFVLNRLFMTDAKGLYSDKLSYKLELLAEPESGHVYGIEKYCEDMYLLTVTVDEDFMARTDIQYPLVIDPTVTISGANVTTDTCIDQQYPNSNYYLSGNLWTGGAYGTNAMRSYLKFSLPGTIRAQMVTRAELNVKKQDGYSNPTIRAYYVANDWTPSLVTWNNNPGFEDDDEVLSCNFVATTDNWYKSEITYFVRNWLLNPDENYGTLLKEPAEANTAQKTKFYSSDCSTAAYKPYIVIYYSNTISTRSYDNITSNSINNMAYALEYNGTITATDLGITDTALIGMTNEQIADYVALKAEYWMRNNFGSTAFRKISAYDAYTTYAQSFRVVLRTGFVDSNGNGYYDSGESWGSYWWYQTLNGNGVWADKPNNGRSKQEANTNGIDPASLTWRDSVNSSLLYNSTGRYYEIKDLRDI